MSDCRFGVSPVNYPDPDPEPILFHPSILDEFISNITSVWGTVIFNRNSCMQ